MCFPGLLRDAFDSAGCSDADEVDAVLGHRKGFEHEVTTSLKTELLQLWDGLATREDANVLLMGATNRRGDLDAAVMRRSAACIQKKGT